MAQAITQLGRMIAQFDLAEGFNQTPMSGVRLFKVSAHQPRGPLTYNPGICVVAQGHKVGYLGEQTWQYDPETYLLVSVSMPFECETFASVEEPLYGIYIDVDLPLLNEVISQMGTEAHPAETPDTYLTLGIGPAPLDTELRSALTRLISILASDTESRILGPGVLREILFRVLLGPQAPLLYALANQGSHFSRIARALSLIQTDYAEDLNVDCLAREARMSPSAFHRAFKDVTNESPVQYLKKIRLNKARDFILQDGLKAYMAADRVGYESTSQFSREFKRHFGISPATMVRNQRTS